MKFLTTTEFKEIVFDFKNSKSWNYKGEKPCIIQFTANWCGPCRMITPILEDLEKELNFTLYKVDVDEEYELSEHFNIRSIPTLLFVPLKGEPVSQTGAFPKAELKKLITKHIG
jgi:thioredoxin